MSRTNGFTIFELLVALSLLSLLMLLAAPSYRALIGNNQAVSAANRLVSVLSLARTEAIMRGKQVVVCRSTDGESCSGEGGWELGAITYIDENRDRAYDAEVDGPPLSVWVPLFQGAELTGNSNVSNRVVYLASGLAGFGNGTWRARTVSGHERRVVLSNTGRLRVCNPAESGSCG